MAIGRWSQIAARLRADGARWRRDGTLGLVLIALTAAAMTFALPRALGAFIALEQWTRDLRVAIFTPDAPQDGRIVIVTLNEETLDLAPYRLPADRALLAAVLASLDATRPAAIGLAVPLDRPTESEKDAALRNVIAAAQSPLVLLRSAATAEGAAFEENLAAGHPRAASGLMTDTAGGPIRRYAPKEAAGGAPSFAAALAASTGATTPETPFAIDWRGRPDTATEPFAAFPAYVVARLPPDWFKGKIVLIGYDVPELGRIDTPLNVAGLAPAMPAVTAEAHALSQLLDARTQEPVAAWIEALYALAIAAGGVAFAAWRARWWIKAAAGVAVFALLWALPIAVFSEGGGFLPIVAPVLAFPAAIGAASGYLGMREGEMRALIRNAFALYVPEGVVARLERDPSRLELGGERRVVTILFTDLEGFTSMAESADPQILVHFMNAYMDMIGEEVLAHGGTIGKFIGDGSMSIFGAPESYPDDAARAVQCALAIVDRAAALGEEWRKHGLSTGRTRVGAHTGEALVGNFGGRKRVDYTALGDTVNRAARIEGANKVFGTPVLISDATRRAAGETLCARPAGDVQMKGLGKPERLYEPLPLAERERAAAFAVAFAAIEAGDPSRARDALAPLLAANPADPLLRYYAARLDAGETGVLVTAREK